MRRFLSQPKEREPFVNGAEGCVCGKPGKGVLHDDDHHFLELFEALKNVSSWRKDFFDTTKPPQEMRRFLGQPKEREPFVNGAEGCVRETRKGVLHDDDPHLSELFEALKDVSSWRKDFFDTTKPPQEMRRFSSS